LTALAVQDDSYHRLLQKIAKSVEKKIDTLIKQIELPFSTEGLSSNSGLANSSVMLGANAAMKAHHDKTIDIQQNLFKKAIAKDLAITKSNAPE